MYVAPPLTSGQIEFPEGEFVFSFTTNKERLVKMLGVLMSGEEFDLQIVGDHNIDVIEALANWDNAL